MEKHWAFGWFSFVVPFFTVDGLKKYEKIT
jgi:hypothetical protein